MAGRRRSCRARRNPSSVATDLKTLALAAKRLASDGDTIFARVNRHSAGWLTRAIDDLDKAAWKLALASDYQRNTER